MAAAARSSALLWASVGLLVMSTAYTTLIQASKNEKGGFSYSPLLFLLLSALCKGAAALGMWYGSCCAGSTGGGQDTNQGGGGGGGGAGGAERFRARDFARYTASAALYAVNDVMAFVVMSYFDNYDYSVLATAKVAVVALLTRVLLKRRMTDVQHVSLVVLATGVVLSQYSFCEDAEPVNWEGYAMVAFAEVVGGLAGVVNELLMKAAPEQSLHFQNLNLYVASVVIYVPLLLAYDWDRVAGGRLWEGVSGVVLLMVPLNAARGLSVSAIYLISTNLTKLFVVAFATLLNGVTGHLFFGSSLGAQFVLSFIFIACALYLYGTQSSEDAGSGGGAGGGRSHGVGGGSALRRLDGVAHVPLSTVDEDDDLFGSDTELVEL